ncbi:MAG TPA: sugar phosphate isomerase/epimerase family protein [Bryobacteraceae bacterium]|nr:sugar phosphate isomerase/epimerase family protein [Bryobacteraceae bacterium]
MLVLPSKGMKVGIDSYCFHRFFGEVYPQQQPPRRNMTLEDFLEYARSLKVDGVSLESCFFPSVQPSYLAGLRAMLDGYGLDRVYAWGHPDGLEGGTNDSAYDDMIRSFDHAQAIGAKVMRVVGSSLRFRNQPHGPQLERLTQMFRKAVPIAEEYGIRMAVENHIDFNGQEMLSLLRSVDSPFLGINFDTGNFVRLLDDPVQAMDELAAYTYATHIKDLKLQRGVPANEWYFFSSAPVGDGVVDNAKLIEKLGRSGFDGLLAVETDFLHPDYGNDEHAAVAASVNELRRLVSLY